tara:strand:- start:180 stop:692 length:513 start_codon:yes stop_codon:yes gene_type:complete
MVGEEGSREASPGPTGHTVARTEGQRQKNEEPKQVEETLASADKGKGKDAVIFDSSLETAALSRSLSNETVSAATAAKSEEGKELEGGDAEKERSSEEGNKPGGRGAEKDGEQKGKDKESDRRQTTSSPVRKSSIPRIMKKGTSMGHISLSFKERYVSQSRGFYGILYCA